MDHRKLPAAVSLIALAMLTLLALSPGRAQAGSLGDLLKPRSAEQDILPVDDAFQLQVPIWQNGRLSIHLDIAPGCYLYRDRFEVSVVDPSGYALGAAELPTGTAHHDEHFGDVRILRGQLQARFKPRAGEPPRQLRIRYQGCLENRVCYPPQTRILNVETLR